MEFGGIVDLPVFVETGDEAVGVLHHVLCQCGLRAFCPRSDAATIHFMVDHLACGIEIGIRKIFVVLHAADDVVVVAKAAHRQDAVIPLEIIEDPPVPPSLDIEEDGIDNLHDIIASQFGQEGSQLRQIHQGADGALLRATQVHIARIILPAVAIADEQHLMPYATQGLAEGVMNVAVFAEKKDAHGAINN